MYRTINLPVVLYGCETWSLTFKKEHRLRVLGSRVLRKIFGPKRDEVTGEWRRLHNVELSDLYCSPYIMGVINSVRVGLAGYVACMGESRDAHRVLVGKSEGKRPLVKPTHIWECNIKMGL
jgi:hypothetical protein